MANDEYRSSLIDMPVRLMHTGNRAVLCVPWSRQHLEASWFPLSQYEIAANGDGSHTLTGPEWKFRKAGFL